MHQPSHHHTSHTDFPEKVHIKVSGKSRCYSLLCWWPVTRCGQWCSVWAIIVIIGKWAPSRSGYRVIINSIYSLLFPRTHNFTQSRASAPPSSTQLKSVKRLAAATAISWDELHEEEREWGLLWFESFFQLGEPGECAADWAHSWSDSGRARADKRGKLRT